MAFKYKLTIPDGFIEFPTLESATAWAVSRSIDPATIQELEIIAPRPVIRPVTPRQIRIALLGAGITSIMIEAALDSLPEPTKSVVKITWEYSTLVERESELVDMVAGMLNWTKEQVDALWISAASL